MVFPWEVTHFRKLYEVTVTPVLGSNIPGLYFGDGFVASLVQTGQYILGSKGPCVHCSEIVSDKVQFDKPCLPSEDFTHSPLAEATARHALLTRCSYFQRWSPNVHMQSHRMVANLVCDTLDELTYGASLAGLRYSLDCHSEGLSVCVCGYQDKLPLLLQVVLEKIKNLRPRADRLEVFKEKVRVHVLVRYPELTTGNHRQPAITGIFPCKSQRIVQDIMLGTLSMPYSGPLKRSCLRSRVWPISRHKRGAF